MNNSGLFCASREANTHLQPIKAKASVAVNDGRDFRASKATQDRDINSVLSEGNSCLKNPLLQLPICEALT